ILAIFGIGYRENTPKLRTLFVAPEGSPFLDRVKGFADQIGEYVKYEGTTTDAAAARQELLDDKVDLLVTFPADPLNTVLGGKRAAVTVTHTRLDPIEQTAIDFAAELGVDQFNGQIVAGVVEGGQNAAQSADKLFAAANAKVDEVNGAIAAGDQAKTASTLDELDRITDQLAVSVNASTALTSQVVGADAAAKMQETLVRPTEQMRSTMDELVADPSADPGAKLTRVHDLIGAISGNYQQFTSVDSAVLVQPFESKVDLAVPGNHDATDWYAPAAVVLMLQQFGVAFGALSFVRERQTGILDVYKVAPVSATEALVGKYLAYLPIGGIIGAALTALIVGVLGVADTSSLPDLAIVMGLSLFASIGLGFIISLVSGTDAQAVQYTVIVLLASLFFSGFFLSTVQLEGIGQAVSWLLPVSYGMEMLRDVMLRGAPINRDRMIGLAAYGVIAFLLALIGTRRRMDLAS
ncbi:MAG TPA: ABC transporter permease, partial [Ilumatobacteraceae bacterium]